jgi:citrate synthase
MGRAEPELSGKKIRALERLSNAVDTMAGRAITINATGAVAALLGELGISTKVMRGFAVISRAAGLVAHIVEEQQSPSGRFIWDTVEHAIPYVGADGKAADGIA